MGTKAPAEKLNLLHLCGCLEYSSLIKRKSRLLCTQCKITFRELNGRRTIEIEMIKKIPQNFRGEVLGYRVKRALKQKLFPFYFYM